MLTLMYILLALTLKHFICDFPLQVWPYMYLNKGTYGHPGGVLHSLIHVFGTVIALCWFISDWFLIIQLAIVDGSIHYHVDLMKVKITRYYNLKPDNSQWFWILLGIDQTLHFLTYYGILYFLIIHGVVS